MDKPSEIQPRADIPFSSIPQTQLSQALEWLLANPSIPLSLRKQFYVLWETVIFGNYTERDIRFLVSKFREWCILMLWFIPEHKWGNIMRFKDSGDPIEIEYDLNLLLNTLEQIYYINLTRGRDGFTVREMNTQRVFSKTESETERKKEFTLRLF